MNILIVDDNSANLLALSHTLMDLDATLTLANSGEEALKILLRSDSVPDVAILDVQMPTMDGYELAKIMRSHPRTQHIPIIFLSAIYTDDWCIGRGYKSGAVDFLTKPFNPDILCAKVNVFLDIARYRKENESLILDAKHQAEVLAQSKTEFLANMSHEIRTPIHAIMGLSYLALQKETFKEAHHYLETIQQCTLNLMCILNDILDSSKLEAGTITPEFVSFNLDFLLQNINNLFAHNAEEKGLKFEIDLGSDVPRDLIGDGYKLQQIITNLIRNAINFTATGTIIFKIALQKMEASKARVLFSVTDTGIGLSEDNYEKIFQPFSQADGSITRRFGGTGLGLSISQKLLRMMGGEFVVQSVLDEGSCFSFELTFDIPTATSVQSNQNDMNRPTEVKKFHKTQHHLSLLNPLKDSFPRTSYEIEELKRLITELNELLDENDFISDRLLDTLKSYLNSNQIPLFSKLYQLIRSVKYSEARKILQRIAELNV